MTNIWSWSWFAFAVYLCITGFAMDNIEKGNAIIYLSFIIGFFSLRNID